MALLLTHQKNDAKLINAYIGTMNKILTISKIENVSTHAIRCGHDC